MASVLVSCRALVGIGDLTIEDAGVDGADAPMGGDATGDATVDVADALPADVRDAGVDGADAPMSGDATGDATVDVADALTADVPDAGSEACAPSGTGKVGTLGCPCSPSGALGCNGNAQKVTLICSGGVWTLNQTCPSGLLCDTASGLNQGTCQPIDPPCTSASPGQDVCGSGTTVVQCGADLVSDTPVATCASQTCVSAVCMGMCAPTQTNPVACGNCGTDTQTCSASGAWQPSGSCAGQGCAPSTTQACNTYGTQTCSASCAWGACSCTLAPVCTPGATQCPGSSATQTCDLCGQWGSAIACSGGTPFCVSGACSANPPSCAPGGAGMTDCGASSESCCTSLEVTGGTYDRTYTNNGGGATGMADLATVSGYRQDKYPVTVGRFRQFVTAWNGAAGYTPPAGSGKHTHLNGGQGLSATGGGFEPGWVASDDSNIAPTSSNLASCSPYSTWTSTASTQEDLPINCVSWWESYAFCIWDGGFLPSEAEWEYSAAGGNQLREYPWGTAAAGTACPGTGCQYAIYNCDYPSGSGSCTGVLNMAPVGTATLGAGAWGQLDLVGEGLEWNLDWYGSSYIDPCTDCANLTPASNRVVRGAGYDGPTFRLLPPARFDGPPAGRSQFFGFRCSRTP